MDINVPVVIDTGSETTKAGFAGESNPRTIFASVVGRPRGQGKSTGSASKELYVGDDAMGKRDALTMKYPVEWGTITNYDDCERLWHYALYDKLKVQPEDCPILLTEAILNAKASREKMTQYFFETERVPAFYLADTAKLSMCACGKGTGVVLEIGGGHIFAAPVYEQHVLPYTVGNIPSQGRALTYFLIKLFSDRGIELSKPNAEEIKKDFCSVARNFEEDIKTSGISSNSRTFQISERESVTVGKERFECAEALFHPTIMGLEFPGIHEVLFNSVMKCNENLREKLFSNIVLSGGSTMFPGLPERLTSEMMKLVPSKYVPCVNVHAAWDRHLAAWQGGSMLASEGQFLDMCITLDMYDEYGPALVHRMCF